jgi:diguanylate cyclase (GGDEF)-like protein/PAS domain S-box-containing protein
VDEPTFLGALGRFAREVVISISDDGRVRSAGDQPRILGYPPDFSHDGRHIAEYVHPDDLPRVLGQLDGVRAGRDVETSIRVRARHHDGRWVTLVVDIFDARLDPTVGDIVLRLFRDDEIAPFRADDPLAGVESLAEALSAGVLSADGGGQVVYANSAAQELFWMSRPALLGDGWLTAVAAPDIGEVIAAASAAFGGSGRQEVSFRMRVGEDRHRWVHARFQGLSWEGRVTGWVAIFDDITAQRSAESALAHQATHDALTGLPNRLLLNDRIEQAIARLRRSEQRVGLLFIDVDGFKSVNDQFGHAAGDEVLVEIAERLRGAVRPDDTAARVGGDEFVVLADAIDSGVGLLIGQRISAAVGEPIPVAGTEVVIGTSIGVALGTSSCRADELLAHADQAMFRAKRANTDVELAE